MKRAVRNTGPVSVMFQAPLDFYSYSSGIYYSIACNDGKTTTHLHSLLIIGFGTENG